MMNCQETARLVSEGMDHKLSFSKRLKLKTHLRVCAICGRVAKQLEMLRALAQQAGSPDVLATDVAGDMSLSNDAKNRIKTMLASQSSGD